MRSVPTLSARVTSFLLFSLRWPFFDRVDGFFEHGFIHCHQVAGFRKTPALHVSGVFFEGSDALVLEALVLFAKVSVSLGMAGNPFVVIAEDVVGEEKLRV